MADSEASKGACNGDRSIGFLGWYPKLIWKWLSPVVLLIVLLKANSIVGNS